MSTIDTISNSQDTLSMKVHDLNMRYSRCLFKYNGNVCIVDSFYVDEDRIILRADQVLPRNDYRYTKVYILDYYTIDFSMPKLGYFNVDSAVYFCQRVTNRSSDYKFLRGFNNNVVEYIPKRGVIHLGTISNKILSYKLLTNEFTPFQEAVAKIYSFEIAGAALSSNIAIKVSFKDNRIVVCSREVVIGVWVHLRNSFRMFTNAFNNELSLLEVPYVELKGSIVYPGGETVVPSSNSF